LGAGDWDKCFESMDRDESKYGEHGGCLLQDRKDYAPAMDELVGNAKEYWEQDNRAKILGLLTETLWNIA
jgi:hypothetical protein